MMFELEQQVKLSDVNPRSEMHGDERRPIFDLTFIADCSNDILINFHPNLRSMLFQEPASPDLADQASEVGALTELRFPLMGIIKWDWQGTGYHLTVGYGVGGKSDIKLGECIVDKFSFDPKQGGSVSIKFRVIAHPEGKDVGKLCELIQQEVGIILVSPSEEDAQVSI